MKKEYKYTINGNKYEVVVNNMEGNTAEVVVNGDVYNVEKEKEPDPVKKKVVVRPVDNTDKQAPVSNTGKKSSGNIQNAVKSPLPGVITEIKVSVGDEVKAGDTVVVLEAMKMANNLETERSGKVTEILVSEGESVMEDTPLVVIE